MNCPQCGERTYVVNSRHADSTGYRVNQAILDVANRLVSWYTKDWVVRRRVCRVDDCYFDEVTIEVSAEDLEEMLRESANDEGPFPAKPPKKDSDR
jgi:hypothetical protein